MYNEWIRKFVPPNPDFHTNILKLFGKGHRILLSLGIFSDFRESETAGRQLSSIKTDFLTTETLQNSCYSFVFTGNLTTHIPFTTTHNTYTKILSPSRKLYTIPFQTIALVTAYSLDKPVAIFSSPIISLLCPL